MDPNMFVQVGKTIWNAGGIGYWKYVIFAVFIFLVSLGFWAMFCKANIQPNEHALRKTFSRYKFVWYDGLEDTPELRRKWYHLVPQWPGWWRLQPWPGWRAFLRVDDWKVWWKAKMTKRRNSRDAKAWRNSPDGNKPHEQLRFGTPVVVGPGWYTKGPKDMITSLDPEDTRNRVVDLTLYVMDNTGFRVYVLPIQLTIRIADLYLWKQTCNVVEGGVLGVARQKSRQILKLGYDVIRDNDELVATTLMDAMSVELQPGMSIVEQSEAMRGKIEWYGAEAVFVNPAAPEYKEISFVAEALRLTAEDGRQPGEALADFRRNGAAVTAVLAGFADDLDDPISDVPDADDPDADDEGSSLIKKSLTVGAVGAAAAAITAVAS